MSVNKEKYTEAMDDFLQRMKHINKIDVDAISAAIRDVCETLKIAQIVINYRCAPKRGENPLPKAIMLFPSGASNSDMEKSICFEEVCSDGSTWTYSLFCTAGAEDWSDDEKTKINLFGQTLASYIEKLHIENVVNNLMFHDNDLGIYNLSFFMKTAARIIAIGEISNYGSCYFNLRRFSVVNQNFGHKKGTHIMREYIRVLQDKIGTENYVCRIGGDNFVVLFEKPLLNLVMEYLNGHSIIIEPEREKVFISAYAGYYMIPDDCRSPTDIMDNLSVAVNTAKNVLNTEYVFFDDNLIRTCNAAKALESVFPTELKDEKFHIYYQPKVRLTDYRLSGAEALCRWNRNGKIISPGEFVPTLEQSRNICLLDFYMLEHVCMDIRRWLDEGRPVVRVSVNFSRRHLGNMNILERIITTIDKYHVPHEYIEVELTETTTDVNFADLKVIVNGLKAAGISTSVDDFGMGYSSLNLIKELPWNVLKIDKSFLPDDKQMSSQKYAMLKHVISLAQELGLECIAEGVETAEHVRLLKENNCFMAQGFYFDRPLPIDEFEKRLNDLKN